MTDNLATEQSWRRLASNPVDPCEWFPRWHSQIVPNDAPVTVNATPLHGRLSAEH